MNETQETITRWGEETFGVTHPYHIARRMVSEVNELLEKLVWVKDKPVAEIDQGSLDSIREECADVAIMLDQIAELVQVDLQEVKNYKMSVNRKRRWGYDSELNQIRHIDEGDKP